MNLNRVTRRSFLKVSTLIGGGLVLKAFWAPAALAQSAPAGAGASPWLLAEFRPDGTLLLRLSKMEMGQSAPSGVAMLFAEEVGADWDKVRVTQLSHDADTRALYDSPIGGATGGSSTVSAQWEPMRKAGASVREMLIQAAARRWDAPPDECEARDGAVIHRPSGRRAPFAELAEAAAALPVPENPGLKDRSAFTLIGKPKPNARNRELCSGAAPYGINVKLPGMVYAAIHRCPVRFGTLKSYNDVAARAIPGVLDVVVLPGHLPNETLFVESKPGIAVIADSTWAAFRGKQALVAEWDEGAYASANVDTLRERCARREFIKTETKNDFGDPEAAFAKASRIHESTYETHFQAHACMEPLNATARIDGDRVEVWSSTQDSKAHAEAIAGLLRVPVDKVTVHSLVAGGSFGRRIWLDFPFEAVLVAKAIGRPVKVTWTREDEIQHDYLHPYERSVWRASLGEDNLIDALTNDFGVVGAPSFWWILHWAYLPYGIPNHKVTANMLEEPVASGAWRSVTEHLGAFSEECFIDEMAALAGEDPYRFRLKHARRAVATFQGDDYWRRMTRRALDVLESVPRYVDWESPLPENRGRGLAISKFGSTVVLQVAEVEVTRGDFFVRKVDAIVAPGIVVNPQLAENQIEGAILWALSALKYGKLTLENGRIQETNFDRLQLLRIDETPEMRVHFLEDDGPMGGIGEPGVPALAPAALNALYAATGKRLRSLPVDRSALA